MVGNLRRALSGTVAAWSLVGLLAGVMILQLLGAINLNPGTRGAAGPLSYAAASERLVSADRAHAPAMKLEGQFAGPLTDTTIERWRDPVDGTVCYVYLPIAVAHSAGPSGLVQYGSANIGSLSCFAGSPPQ